MDTCTDGTKAVVGKTARALTWIKTVEETGKVWFFCHHILVIKILKKIPVLFISILLFKTHLLNILYNEMAGTHKALCCIPN